MATGIDFMAIARGREAALSDNYKDIRRIQEQEQYGFSREQQLAKQLQERQNREATRYLSTVMPNLQRYADQGLNPVDALLNQRTLIQNHAGFQSMTPEVQTLILNGLGETAKLQAQALAKAGNYADLERLTSAFGSVNPLNPLGIAVASGDPLQVFKAVSERSPGAYTLSADQKFVVDRAGNSVPLADWAAYTAAGLGEANSAAGGLNAFQQAGQQQRAQTAADALKAQEQTYNALLAIKSGMMQPLEAKRVFPLAVLPEAPGSTTAWGATVATPEQVAALSTPVVAGEASAQAPAQAPAVTTPVTPLALQQISALIQNARAPQLDSSLATITQQIEEGKARAEELVALKARYQQELTKVLPVFAERGIGQSLSSDQEDYIAAIQRELARIDQEARAIAQNMRGFDQIAKQIQTRKRMLGLPANTGAPQTDWLSKLQSELSQ